MHLILAIFSKAILGIDFWARTKKTFTYPLEAYGRMPFFAQMTEANASEELVHLCVSEESIDYELSGAKDEDFSRNAGQCRVLLKVGSINETILSCLNMLFHQFYLLFYMFFVRHIYIAHSRLHTLSLFYGIF